MKKLIRSLLILTVAALGIPATSSAALPGSFSNCKNHPHLKGTLKVRVVGCSKADKIVRTYFATTQPGHHVGPKRVGGYACNGSVKSRKFHISCHNRKIGSVGLRFVGVES